MKKGKIIYIYDALCGWCYAMGDVMMKISKEYSEEFDFEVLSGGMVLGDRAGKIGDKFDYINEAFKTVESHTGAKFGPKFLEALKKGELEMNSLEPSIALTAFKNISNENQLKFAHDLQDALYFDGKDIRDYNITSDIAVKNGVKKEDFLSMAQTEEIKSETEKEFETVASFGVSGFPTIIFEKNEEFYLIARGYQHYIDLKNVLKKLKSSISEN